LSIDGACNIAFSAVKETRANFVIEPVQHQLLFIYLIFFFEAEGE
jgi:hypothetical protein